MQPLFLTPAQLAHCLKHRCDPYDCKVGQRLTIDISITGAIQALDELQEFVEDLRDLASYYPTLALSVSQESKHLTQPD